MPTVVVRGRGGEGHKEVGGSEGDGEGSGGDGGGERGGKVRASTSAILSMRHSVLKRPENFCRVATFAVPISFFVFWILRTRSLFSSARRNFCSTFC